MPKMSGFEVCKRLRANPATKDVAVLMVTALDQAADVERAVDAGTDDFLTKPVNKTELLLLRAPSSRASSTRTNSTACWPTWSRYRRGLK